MSEVTGSDPCPILSGKVWAFGLDVPAVCIVPEATGSAASGEVGAQLLTPVDPEFPSRIQSGDILAAGSFGRGTRDDRPVRAICEAGIAAVVASSFDPVFAEHARAAALPLVEIYEALALHTGESLRVDLEGARIVNMSSGNRYPIRNLDEEVLEVYRRHLEGASEA